MPHPAIPRSVISILTDESTSSSGIACLIIYLRYTFNDFPINIFVDLLELNATNPSEIANQIQNCLHRHGFSDSYLSDNLLGFCGDGASIMTEPNTGALTQLKQKFPRLVGWHCLNHRFELALSDAVNVAVIHFKCFMDTLYALYSTHSSKKERKSFQQQQLSWKFAFLDRPSSQYTVGGLVISNCKGRFAQL